MRKSKYKRKIKPDRIGKSAECMHCKSVTPWFVVMGSGARWCLDCMEQYGWEHLSAVREAIMKDGGANGSKTRALKPKGNRYLARGEVSGQVTLPSIPDTDDW